MPNARRELCSIVAVAMAATFLVACATARTTADAEPTTFFVVRHAEKATGDDPPLTEEGAERARALARMLADVSLDAVYATPFVRTQETALPAAEGAGREVQTDAIPDGDRQAYYQDFVGNLKQRHAGGRVLLVGHSNTVPMVVAALGVEQPPTLGDEDYDDLFVVTVADEGGPLEFLHLHYGAASP